MKDLKQYTCFSCGLINDDVECAGMFHCPNDLCLGCGAAYFRSTLKSYKESGDQHTVDGAEWLSEGIKNMRAKKPLIYNWVVSSGHLSKFAERAL